MNHEAIYKLYPQVITIKGDHAYDKDENPVEIDPIAIENKSRELAVLNEQRIFRQTINEDRDKQFEDLLVQYNGYRIEGHAKARNELNAITTSIILSRSAGLPDETVKWTTADDTDESFTYDDMLAIATAVKNEYARIHTEARFKKSQWVDPVIEYLEYPSTDQINALTTDQI